MAEQNLSSQPTAFVGRTRELAELTGLLDTSDCRLLTLVGPGGIGKTRLTLEAGATWFNQGSTAGAFPAKVYFVPLQPLTSPDFILSALAEAIGIQFYTGDEPLPQVIDFLCPQAALLVLDNFEHLLDGVGLVSSILAGAPKVKILATSRETLNLQEEWLYQVKGMHVPDTESDDLERYGAVQLFVKCAQRARPDFSLVGEKASVQRICQLVEGMPLALEMTAAWLKRLPCGEIVEHLERGLDILVSPTRNVPERHRSMRTVFEHSWNLLTDPERDVFKKLSVFRGGFRRRAAEAIAGASLHVLAALVDKSLLSVNDGGRYDLHELLRQYAEEQLNATPDVCQQAHALHCKYFLDFIEQRYYALHHEQREVQHETIVEMDNLRAAWNWGIEHQVIGLTKRLIYGLVMLYRILGLYQEGEQVFAKAADLLRSSLEVAFAYILQSQGRMAQWQGKYDTARKCFDEVILIGHTLS